MATTPTNLFELTVTCRQCGSAGMERIGPREYRCTHCGAITVVSQEADAQHATAGIDTTSAPQVDDTPDPVLSPEAEASAESMGRHLPLIGFGICVLLAIGFVGLMHACGGDDHPGRQTIDTSVPAKPAVPTSQLSVTPAQWANDASATGRSETGKYTSLLTNHSAYAVTVPSYSMTLFLRGTRIATAELSVPVPTLLPGEYEPISFAFQSPSDDPHPEITPPATADRADSSPVSLQLAERQLVQVQGARAYKVVGVVNNTSSQPAKNIVVAVMLFDASHTLTGYGSYHVNRALRAGDRTAIQVDIPTANVNPVASYEYLIDAVPDTP